MEPGRPVGGTYYLYRTLRQLDYDGLAERLMERGAQQGRATGKGEGEGDEGDLAGPLRPRGVRGAACASCAT